MSQKANAIADSTVGIIIEDKLKKRWCWWLGGIKNMNAQDYFEYNLYLYLTRGYDLYSLFELEAQS